MDKHPTRSRVSPPEWIRQIRIIMRLIIFLVLTANLAISATGYSQQVTLVKKNAPLREVLVELRNQTGFDFICTDQLLKLANPVSIDVHERALQDVLHQIFAHQPLDYTIANQTVVIKPAAGSQAKAQEMDRKAPVEVLGSQQRSISGRVVDSLGAPLSSVTVRLKGTNQATVTDKEGRFSLRLTAPNGVLEISLLGYLSRELPITANLNAIVLYSELAELDEVVVSTGYQRIEKSQLTGAASVVNRDIFDQRVSVSGNFLENLEGKVPGLVYNSQSGELSIRGVSTFDAVKQPLIVVDGFPTEIDLLTINPNDVVSVSVLRDAAAASIYGVRASNGVIVIETRRGKEDTKTNFNLRATYGLRPRPDFDYLNYAGAREVIAVQELQFDLLKPLESNYTQRGYPKNPAYEILFDREAGRISASEAATRLAALGSYDNMEDYKSLFYRPQQTANLNFDISGGGARHTYLAGVNYIGEQLNGRRDGNSQVNVNLANTFVFSPRLNADFKATYSNKNSDAGGKVGYDDFFPYERLTDDAGNPIAVKLGPGRDFDFYGIDKARNDRLLELGMYDQYYYPYGELFAHTQTTKSASTRLQGRLNGKVTDWLSAEIGGSYELQQGTLDDLQTDDAYVLRAMINSRAKKNPLTGAPEFNDLPQGDRLTRSLLRSSAYTVRGQLNVDRTFTDGVHAINGIVGIEQRRILSTSSMSSYFGYDGQVLISKPVNFPALAKVNFPEFNEVGMVLFSMQMADYFNETHQDTRFMSYYATGTYAYKDRYVATGSLRLDQSNLFGVDPKYKNKPLWSAGASWLLHKENFLNQVAWINDAKLRFAMGFNGNVPTSDSGPFLILQSQLNAVPYVSVIANNVLSPENQSIRWETTRNYNTGLDFSLFRNRLSGSIDAYLKNSFDLFGQFDADPTTGFNQYNANTASIRNQGIEFIVSTVNIRRPRLEWRTDLTASFNDNTVLAVKATEYSNSQLIVSNGIHRKDYPMDAVFSYRYGGLNDKGHPFVYDTQGNQRVLNFYGNNRVDVLFNDLIYNGTTTPKYVLGLNNRFRIGQFEVAALFMYYGGHVMRIEQSDPNNLGPLAIGPLLAGSENFWTAPGDEQHTRIPGFSMGNVSNPYYFPSYALYGYQYASEFVKRADYIRLRDVVVSYHADSPFLKKIGFSQTEIRLQAQNPWRYTFSDNSVDPDAIDRQNGQRFLLRQPPMYSLSLFTNF